MRRFFVFSIIFAFAAAILSLAWFTPKFSDVYVTWIFPLWIGSYGRLTAMSRISVGEIMLYTAAGLVALCVLSILLGFLFLLFKKKGLIRFGFGLFRVILDIASVVFLIQVLNCFVLYHTTPLYSGTEHKGTNGEIIELREMLVTRANELAPTLSRDSAGDLVYDGDMGKAAVSAIKHLSSDYPRLEGFCSEPKPLWKSDFFSQQNIAGYYFPFSLEANYNDIMYISNKPSTMCHELAHLKGYIREDEANFISYLACTGSGDPFFEYSGILMALSYVNGEVYKMIDADPGLMDRITLKNEYVIHDCVFLTEETWATVEADALIDTDIVAEVSDDFLNANLTANGIEEGTVSYSKVVDLLLKYYYGDNKNG